MKKRAFLLIGLMVAMPIMTTSLHANDMDNSMKEDMQTKRENPLLVRSTLPFGAPDFSKIQTADFLPAFQEAIQLNRDNIQRIVNNPQKPSFKNTILAFEEADTLLNRVEGVYHALLGAHKTPELSEIQKQITPMLTDLSNEILFNQALFNRIKTVYENEYGALKGEDKKLLEETYKYFTRAGALLPEEKKARMKQINSRISDLQQQWGDMLPEATNDAVVWVNSREELAGLSEADINQCRKDAESRGGKAPYCIVIINTTQQPLLSKLDHRDLRRRVYEASIHRADGSGKHNTYPIVVEIAKLRAEKARLMGFDNYAEYSLEKTMAKNPKQVYDFLKQLIASYLPKAEKETRDIEAYARKTMGSYFKLQPYDRFYFSAKMKEEMLQLSDEEIRPYFNIDSVQTNGVFYAAQRVYGLSFKERKDIPLYHPDMRCLRCSTVTGNPSLSSTAIISGDLPKGVGHG